MSNVVFETITEKRGWFFPMRGYKPSVPATPPPIPSASAVPEIPITPEQGYTPFVPATPLPVPSASDVSGIPITPEQGYTPFVPATRSPAPSASVSSTIASPIRISGKRSLPSGAAAPGSASAKGTGLSAIQNPAVMDVIRRIGMAVKSPLTLPVTAPAGPASIPAILGATPQSPIVPATGGTIATPAAPGAQPVPDATPSAAPAAGSDAAAPAAGPTYNTLTWGMRLSDATLKEAEYNKFAENLTSGALGEDDAKIASKALVQHHAVLKAQEMIGQARISGETFDPIDYVKRIMAHAESDGWDAKDYQDALGGFSEVTGIKGSTLIQRFFSWFQNTEPWQKIALFVGIPMAIAGIANATLGGGGFLSAMFGVLGLGAAAIGTGLFGKPLSWASSASSFFATPGDESAAAASEQPAATGENAAAVPPQVPVPVAAFPATSIGAISPEQKIDMRAERGYSRIGLTIDTVPKVLEEALPGIATLSPENRKLLVQWVGIKLADDASLSTILHGVDSPNKLTPDKRRGLGMWLYGQLSSDTTLQANPDIKQMIEAELRKEFNKQLGGAPEAISKGWRDFKSSIGF